MQRRRGVITVFYQIGRGIGEYRERALQRDPRACNWAMCKTAAERTTEQPRLSIKVILRRRRNLQSRRKKKKKRTLPTTMPLSPARAILAHFLARNLPLLPIAIANAAATASGEGGGDAYGRNTDSTGTKIRHVKHTTDGRRRRRDDELRPAPSLASASGKGASFGRRNENICA